MRRPGGLLAVLAVLARPVVAQEPAPPPPPAEAPDRPDPGSEGGPTVSTPPMVGPPAAGRTHARSGVVSGKPVSLTREATSTVTLYEKGKTVTVRTPAGTLETYRLAKNASVPSDLAAGRAVLVETRFVKKRRYASRVTYAESRVVMTNVDDGPPR